MTITGPSGCTLSLLPCGLYDTRAIRIQALAKRYAEDRVLDIKHIWSDHSCGPCYADDDRLRTEYPDASRGDMALFAETFMATYRARLIDHAKTCMDPRQAALVVKLFNA